MSPVDEVRAARALRALRKHAREHPEAFHPDRLPTSPAALAVVLGEREELLTRAEAEIARLKYENLKLRRIGRPPSDDPMVAMGIRIPRSMVAAVDAARGGRSTGEIVREALARWLKAERRRR